MALIKVYTNQGRMIAEFRSEDYNTDHADPRIPIPVEQNTFAQLVWDIANAIRESERVQQGETYIDEIYGEYPNYNGSVDTEGDPPLEVGGEET